MASRKIRNQIKQDRPGPGGVRMIEYAVGRLQEEATDELRELLAPDVVLVPAPKSAPFPPRAVNPLWVPKRICEALVAAGFGGSVLPCLRRATAVQKSAFAAPGGRPTIRTHVDSMAVKAPLVAPERIVVVDDFITLGSTVLAATSILRDAFPEADVKAFALVRTRGLIDDIPRIVHPVCGRVTSAGRRGWREP